MMSGSYHPESPAGSEHQDQISPESSPARPEYHPLGDLRPASDVKISSSNNGHGWGQEEATTFDLLATGFHDKSKTHISHFDRSHVNP